MMASYNIEGKTFLVTGGAGGLGSVTVITLIENRAKHVAILDLCGNDDLKNDISSKYGDNKISFHKCDVTKPEEVDKVFQKVATENGHVDAVMNFAGIATDHAYAKLVSINFTALVSVTLRAVEYMRADKGGKGGTVINIASSAALDTCSNNKKVPVYCGTKRAVMHFSNYLSAQLSYDKTAVRIMTICFGLTDTSIVSDTKLTFITDYLKEKFEREIPLLVFQSPEKAIETVVEAFRRGATGSTWLSNEGKDPQDITDYVNKAYAVMSSCS